MRIWAGQSRVSLVAHGDWGCALVMACLSHLLVSSEMGSGDRPVIFVLGLRSLRLVEQLHRPAPHRTYAQIGSGPLK